ncbi:methionine--tRNA ligase [Amygdalobacter nucleatus]|uniref:Methionine--tRNA ligase n=1 Tax=Amygdalobacter nucleatus TaxID=3029274 RepID=A0A133YGV2_9FIRM|nr:methionine--tRNA ligase [Amygdalobacter nucleatus]KXB42397.1 methionine--tRNA ligase [Amygdalobacter nucleatus]MDF0485973.1 methionine--tRNA ligase [Amygdalobacter nucleatus]WEG37469.1 methionine--tRNA ligase [Amygdalobacter nucleatus]
MQEKFYISTPIYYPSNKLHIGNSYTTVLADYVARYQRLLGKEVFFLTGTDEHGQKIEKVAQEKGLKPLEFTNGIVAWIKELWQKLDISYDYYIRTTDADHCKRVQAIFQKLYDKGDIYKNVYKGWYCTPCETFLTDTQVGAEHLCPDCNRPVETAEEECYFFRLSHYQDRLLKLYHDNPDFLVPNSRVNEMVKNFIEPGLQDLAVSRTSFSWGVPVPFDPKHVIYVWVDALSNYITALHYPDEPVLPEIWHNSLQILGKDIVRFHAIIWPALLMALDLPLPKKLYAHGWLMFKDDKMSKSKGNIVDPMVLTDRYGVDPIRYYLLSELPYGGDGHFSNESLIERINIHLANDLGNLYSRSVAMFVKYFQGKVPSDCKPVSTAFDTDLEAALEQAISKYHKCFEENQYSNSLAAVFTLVRRANKYIDETAPWILAKDESKKGELLDVMLHLLEVLRQVALCLYPAMPNSMLTLLNGLGQKTELTELVNEFKTVGKWQAFSSKETLVNASPLFPRLDMDKEINFLNDLLAKQQAALAKKSEPTSEEATNCKLIDFSDFTKLDMRVGTVISCEKVKGADKLLHELIDLGSLGQRHIVSGIAEQYQAEELVGKQVVVLCNLPKRKLKGIESEAMLLTAVDQAGNLRLLQPEQKIENGSKIS